MALRNVVVTRTIDTGLPDFPTRTEVETRWVDEQERLVRSSQTFTDAEGPKTAEHTFIRDALGNLIRDEGIRSAGRVVT